MPKKVYTKEQIRQKRQEASSALHRVQAYGNRDRSTRPTGSPLSSAVQKTVSRGLKAADAGYWKLDRVIDKGERKVILGTIKGIKTGWGIIKNPNHRYNK